MLGRSYLWPLHLKMLLRGLWFKSYHLVTLFQMLITLGNVFFFSDTQSIFRSSRSIANLMTDVVDRIDSALNTSRATRAVVLDKAFVKVQLTGLTQKCKSCGLVKFSDLFFLLFCKNSIVRVVLDGKSSQKYPNLLGFLKTLI